MRALIRKLRSGFSKPAFVLLWLVPSGLLLGLCRLAILVLSFRRLASLLGVAHGSSVCIPLLNDSQRRGAARIGQVVRLAASLVPWTANCYPQALTTCLMLVLYRVPHCLCFGVARDQQNQGFSAHAWVAAGNVRVIGGYGFSRYRVLTCFVWLPGPAQHRHDVRQAGDRPSSLAASRPEAPAGDA